MRFSYSLPVQLESQSMAGWILTSGILGINEVAYGESKCYEGEPH